MNTDKLHIGKGAAIGVIFGYFISLRFGLTAGIIAGFVIACITTDVRAFALAMVDVKKTAGDLKVSLRSGWDTVLAKLEGPRDTIVEFLVGFAPTLWALSVFIVTALIEDAYLGKPWTIATDGTERHSMFANSVAMVLLLIIIMVWAVWADKAHEKCMESGPLSWRCYKLFIHTMKKVGDLIGRLLSIEWPALERLIDWAEGLIPENARPFDRIADWWGDGCDDPKDGATFRFNAIAIGVLASIGGMIVFALMPVAVDIIAIPIQITVIVLALDLVIMVFLRIASTKSLAAGEGAVIGTALEYALFPSFEGNFPIDYLRCLAFMAIGAAVGISMYAIRRRLLASKTEAVAVS